MMEFNLDQPPDRHLGRRERLGRLDLQPERPGLIGQLPDHGAQGHRRGGQVGHEVVGRLRRGDLAFPDAGADGTLLPSPGASQQAAHRIGPAGQVSQDVGSGPARQQRGCPEIRLGYDPGGVEQALRGQVELVVQLA